MEFRNSLASLLQLIVVTLSVSLLICTKPTIQDKKDFFKNQLASANATGKGNVCIARFESTTGVPLYYTCPRPNESEKKSYCCNLDKCCDYKEFQKQTEQQYKLRQSPNYSKVLDKDVIGKVLKWVLGFILFIIAVIVGCCLLLYFTCRKKKLFTGGVFNSPLPTMPTGPSPYAPPTQPYVAYQWPPENATNPQQQQPPPAYPAYPPYPNAR